MPYKEEATLLDRMIGRVGTALTSMNPGGMVRVENERLHAVCEGLMLQPGDPIEVMGVRGNRVVVRRATAGVLSPPSPQPAANRDPVVATPAPVASVEPESLDFDVPQN